MRLHGESFKQEHWDEDIIIFAMLILIASLFWVVIGGGA
jgi:hypothetical protein